MKNLLLTILKISLAVLFLQNSAHAEEKIIRIGYQKSSLIAVLLKAQGAIEKKLGPSGLKVQWYEFTSGLPLLEALNLGNVDISADVAESVPPFAIAAGAKVALYAQELPSPNAQGILLPSNSQVKSIHDLKGKKIAVAKASGAHYFLLKVLKANNISTGDVNIVYLQPPEARSAFQGKSIDAWATWDPFFSSVQITDNAKILVSGSKAGVDYRRIYLVSTQTLEKNPEVLISIYELLRDTGAWIKKNPKEAAKLHAEALGIESDIAELANSHRSYKVAKIDSKAIVGFQAVADLFFDEKLLPKKINISESPVWK